MVIVNIVIRGMRTLNFKETKKNLADRAMMLETKMNLAYKMLRNEEKVASQKFGKALVTDEERLAIGLSPLDEMKDWYNVCYNLRLTVVSSKRNNIDETEKKLKDVIILTESLQKKMKLRMEKKWSLDFT